MTFIPWFRHSTRTVALKGRQKLLLDVGCGENKQPGFMGMDKRFLPGVDMVHDLEVVPWPLLDGCCSIVKMSHVMEHVCPRRSMDVMAEAWRVLKVGGHFILSMPYGGSPRYYQDPTHCNPWNEATPTYFDPQFPLYEVYKPLPWRIARLFWDQRGDIEIEFVKIARKEV